MKLSRILTSLFVFSSALFAYSSPDAYISEFPVFVNGDVAPIENSFKFIQKIMSDSDFIDHTLIAMGIILTAISGWGIFKSYRISPAIANALFYSAGIMSLTGILSVTVHIEDQRTQIDYSKYGGINYAKVEDIPFPIAAIISASSSLALELTEKVQDATVDVDSDQVSSQAIGFANAFSDVTKMINYAKFTDSDVSTDFELALVEYISTCILEHAYFNGHKDIMKKVRNPQKDIYKELAAGNFGITASPVSFVDSSNNSYSTCGALYGFLTTNYSTVIDETLAKLKDATVSNNAYEDLSKVTNAKISDSLIAGNVGQFKAYIINVASIGPISRAIRNSSATSISGQDLANSMTLEATKAKIQAEGAGQFRWLAEVLPMAHHFFLGIIYACGVFVLIISVALGLEKGLSLISNYAQGLISFEFVKVGLEMANNAVNQYSKFHAADILAAMGKNPASIENLPSHLDYLATMTGLAGILGASAVFFIPTIVFTGKVAVAASAMGGVSSQYKGNNIDTATNVATDQKAQQTAYENAMIDAHALKKAGYEVETPKNMGSGQYYNQLQNDISSASKAMSAAIMGTNKLSDAGHADALSSMGDIQSKATVSNSTDANQHINSGSASGAVTVGSIEGSSAFVEDEGTTDLQKGSKIASLKDKYSMNTVGKELTDNDAKSISESNTSFQNTQDKQKVKSRKEQDLLTDENTASDKTKKAFANIEDVEAAKFAGMGDANITKKDLNSIKVQSKGQFEESAIQANAYENKATKDGNLTEEYKDSVKGAAEAKIGSMIETTKGVGGSDKQVAHAEASAHLKSATDASILSANLEEAGRKNGMGSKEAKEFGAEFGKGAADSFKSAVNTLSDTSATKAGSQTRTDLKSIAAASGSENYKAIVSRDGAAKMGATIATMDAADNGELGSYENQLKVTAREKTQTAAAATKGKMNANQINEDGSLTNEGKDAVSTQSEFQAYQTMGNTEGLRNIIDNNPEYLQNFVNKSLKAARKESPEREEAVKNDLISSGLIDKEGNVNAKNWVKAKSFLSANNMVSQNSLMAGGMMFSGALGSNSTVQAVSLNSLQSGDKKEKFDNVDIKNEGDQLNYDPLIDLVGNESVGEIAKGVLQGAVVLGAVDTVTGGKVRKKLMDAKNTLAEKGAGIKGNARGKGDDGKIKTFNPENNLDVEEYLDNNKGAKSRINPIKDQRFDDLPPNTPSKNPQTEEPIKSTTKTATAEKTNVDMLDSLNNDIISESDSILNKNSKDLIKNPVSKISPVKQEAINEYLQNRLDKLDPDNLKDNATAQKLKNSMNTNIDQLSDLEKGHLGYTLEDQENIKNNANTKQNVIDRQNGRINNFNQNKTGLLTSLDDVKKFEQQTPIKSNKEVLNNLISSEVDKLDDNYINGKVDDEGFSKRTSELESMRRRVDSGKIHSSQLKELGIDAKSTGLNINTNGFVDVNNAGATLDNRNTTLNAISDMNNPELDTPKVDVKAPSLGGKAGAVGAAIATVLGVDSMAAEVTGGKSIISNVRDGNYVDASKQTVEAMDPTIVGAQTIFETYDSASKNISNGNYSDAIKNVASTPKEFASNLLNSGFDLGYWGASAYDNYKNNQSVMDDLIFPTQQNNNVPQNQGSISDLNIDTNSLTQEISNQVSQSMQTGVSGTPSNGFDSNLIASDMNSMIRSASDNNMSALTTTGNSMHLDSIGGEVNFGQNNSRMLRVNGMQTGMPYSSFQQEMKNDPSRLRSFANGVAGMDMSSNDNINVDSITSTDTLYNEMMSKFNIQESFAMRQSSNIDSIGSYSSDIIDQTEEMQESFEDLNETLDMLDDIKENIELNN